MHFSLPPRKHTHAHNGSETDDRRRRHAYHPDDKSRDTKNRPAVYGFAEFRESSRVAAADQISDRRIAKINGRRPPRGDRARYTIGNLYNLRGAWRRRSIVRVTFAANNGRVPVSDGLAAIYIYVFAPASRPAELRPGDNGN